MVCRGIERKTHAFVHTIALRDRCDHAPIMLHCSA
jgi:hypothetical protein